MWFLPSYKRPEQAQRAIDSMVAHGMTGPGALLLNENDPTQYDTQLPDNWVKYRVPGDDTRVNDCWRHAFKLRPDEPWYGLMSDDMVVGTDGFERLLVEKAGSNRLASSNDLWQAPARMTGAAVFGGDLVRAIGDLAPIPSRHCFFDDFWEMVGRDFGVWDVLMDVHVEHLHPYAGKAVSDETHVRANHDMAADQELFVNWCHGNKGQLYTKIGTAVGKHARVVNLSGVRLVIGTPTHDGRFTLQYLRSFMRTIEALRGLGVTCDLITVPGESLITRARNHIVRQFRQTTGTHLLMIDEDMGWEPQSVIRLLVAAQDVDVVGGCGPRKAYPITFCGNFPGGDRIELHPANGLVRLDEIGSGFLLMTRKCLDMMCETYLELRYIEPPAMIELFALFDCKIEAGRYWSEDFAFSRRWRAIGGTVWADPQITLEHVGTHVWKGDLHTDLVEKQAAKVATEAAEKAAAATAAAVAVASEDEIVVERRDNVVSIAAE